LFAIINWPATNRLRFVTRKIELYLEGGAVRGLLKSPHPRLSDHLRDPEESFVIDEAVITSYRAKEPIVSGSSAIVGKSQILFAVDFDEGGGQETMRVERTAQPVALCVGPFWLRGNVHLPVGGDLRAYFDSDAMSFIPLTNAVVAGRDGATPRTLLINMARVGLVAPLADTATPPEPPA
jgi:hypothetical protein